MMHRALILLFLPYQIRTQGWTADSGWSGGMTAGTVWTRNDSNDRPLVGTMRIAEASNGVFNARFTVISVAPADDFGGSSSWSTYERGVSSVQSLRERLERARPPAITTSGAIHVQKHKDAV